MTDSNLITKLPLSRSWPRPLGEEAFQGPAAELVRSLEAYTEADPVAILVQLLVAFGNAIGRNAWFRVEATLHFLNEFVAVVGQTAKARKGLSLAHVTEVFGCVDSGWCGKRICGGLSSAEGLIWAVRDPVPGQKPADPGVADKRLLVVEEELASTLTVMGRTGNNLSAILRQAWDGPKLLQSMTKNSLAKSTQPHISLIGHTTFGEVRRRLSSTEAGNGFANRFLWICVRRSKFLPEGGRPKGEALDRFADALVDLESALEQAKGVGEVKRDEDARQLWFEVYPELSEGGTGLLGAVTSRAEAHVTRLSCLYALMDKSPVVRVEHLRAALAVWEYSLASARFIFGNLLGDETADEILMALKRQPQGMTRTQINDLFKRNKSSAEISRALGVLHEHGLASP